MVELAQLFQDLDQIVQQQEPLVENIEAKGEEIHENVVQANTEIGGAIVKARSARRKKWWCLLICKIDPTLHPPSILTHPQVSPSSSSSPLSWPSSSPSQSPRATTKWPCNPYIISRCAHPTQHLLYPSIFPRSHGRSGTCIIPSGGHPASPPTHHPSISQHLIVLEKLRAFFLQFPAAGGAGLTRRRGVHTWSWGSVFFLLTKFGAYGVRIDIL